MKTSKFVCLILLAAGLTLAGCNRANHIPITTTRQPTAPVELKLNWPVGRHGVQSYDLTTTSETTVPGQAKPVSQEMTMGQSTGLTVTKALDGGKRELEMEYLSLRMKVTGTGRAMEYNSAKKAAGDDPALSALGKMVGAKLHFILDAGNHVESVEGTEDLQNRLSPITQGDSTGSMKSLFSADVVKLMMDHARNLPDKAVQPGDTWPVHQEIPMDPLGTMVADYTFTLDGWEQYHGRWCAHIGIAGTLKTRPGDDPAADSP